MTTLATQQRSSCPTGRLRQLLYPVVELGRGKEAVSAQFHPNRSPAETLSHPVSTGRKSPFGLLQIAVLDQDIVGVIGR
jgi:hypothetical protein